LAHIEHANSTTDTSTTTPQPPDQSAEGTSLTHASHLPSGQRTGQSPMTHPTEAVVARAPHRRCG
jgi:hypothetical protein